MSRTLQLLTALLCICLSSLSAAASVTLHGNIVSEQGSPVAKAKITINGTKVRTDKKGHFSAAIDSSDIYRIDIAARKHFPMIHTFSHYELAKTKESDSLDIPAITLVTKKRGRVMLAFGGDSMMGRRYQKPFSGEPVLMRDDHLAEDTKAIVQHIKPYLKQADYTSINLETQVIEGKPKVNAPKAFVFYTPPEAVEALEDAGVDYVTLGNNHTYDYVDEGLQETVRNLKKTSLGFSGAGNNTEESLEAYRTKIGKDKYSFLGYVGWKGDFSPNQVAGDDKGGATWGSMANVRKSVKREVAKGNNTVIQLHAGFEYSEEPSGSLEYRLKAAIDDGAALAIAHHTHVTQGFEIYKDKLIAYSLGNFIFDQFHYATQPTYLLYVWMDGEKFHRAEIMPIYIKGYVPTPATGDIRNYILKRVATLSARRGLTIDASGGHGVINNGESSNAAKIKSETLKLAATEQEQIFPVSDFGWQASPVSAEAKTPMRFRLGRDVLDRGSFESQDYFGATERAWFVGNDQSGIVVTDQAKSGKRAMKVVVNAGDKSTEAGMRTFERVFTASQPVTFSGSAQTDGDAVMNIYVQRRGSRQGRGDALANSPKILVGSVNLSKGGWQDFSADFNTPREGYRSYRVLAEVTPTDNSANTTVHLDDIALIEWHTTPLEGGEMANLPTPNRMTHVGISTNGKGGEAMLVMKTTE